MAVSFPGLPRGYRYPQLQALTSFAGGVNLRDAASELGPADVVDSWNATYDERGGAASRLGYTKYNNVPYNGSVVQSVFWSPLLNTLVVNAGTGLFLGTSNVSNHTFTTSERVTFAEINTYLVASHPTDGMWVTTDGVTWKIAGTLGTVTVTIASPAVFTLANHGLSADDPVKFTTTGALPTGIVAGTTYYVIAAGLTTNSFEVSASVGGAAVNTSGSQSGVHTLLRDGAPVGTCIATWQNKLWAGKTNGSVQWTTVGDPNHWPAGSFNDLWEKDSLPIVAMHIGSGQDILGRPGLFVFKQDSTYRINNSTTGAYETVDATVGAASNVSVVGVGARVYVLSRRGVFMGQDGQVGLVNMTDKLAPLWDPAQIDLTHQTLWCAGRSKNRALFSLTRAGSSTNNLKLELHTEQGWVAPGSDAMGCYTTSSGTTEKVYGAHPSTVGQVYVLGSGATDDGTAVTGWLQTRWMDLLGGFKASLLHIRVRGRGTCDVEVRQDYHESGDLIPGVSMMPNVAVTYDSGLHYDAGLQYYAPAEEPTVTLYPPQRACRQLSIKFKFTTSATVAAPQVLGANSAPQVGSFAVFLVETMFMRLGTG